MTALSVRSLQYGSPDYEAALDLRRAILRTPLGLDFSAEELAREAADTHFGAWRGARLVGTVVMTALGAGRFRLRQMAVAEDQRGAGVGADLSAALEAHARGLGGREIVLDARETARGFYQRLGYITDDVEFIEVTVPHLRMWKIL